MESAIALFWAIAFASDPALGIEVQRDVINWNISQGKSAEETCLVVNQYFGVDCSYSKDAFLLTRGVGAGISYMATIYTTK